MNNLGSQRKAEIVQRLTRDYQPGAAEASSSALGKEVLSSSSSLNHSPLFQPAHPSSIETPHIKAGIGQKFAASPETFSQE